MLDSDLPDLCKIGLDKNRKLTIWLHPKNDKPTKMTLVAFCTAEYIIDPERVRTNGVVYDMFFLKDQFKNKTTKLVMLATRLVMPEYIIDHIANESEISFSRKCDQIERFDVDGYIQQSDYLPEFIRCAIKESTGMFILDSFSQ